MFIETFPSGPFETNAYVVGCPKTKEAVIIDPAPGSEKSISHYLKQNSLIPKEIWLTHTHWDHIGDVKKLKALYGLAVRVHKQDAPNLRKPGADGLPLFFAIEGVEPDFFLTEGEILTLGDMKWEVIHTPGHSPGSVCFYSKESKTLLSGDTLFKGSIGNLSFPTSDASSMWNSLKKLENLPKETRFFPGHGEPSTIERESWLKDAPQIFGNH